jgi:hypothetical protein
MPYSKKHNVLFIHIPKCAGKSFEVAMGMATKEEVSGYKWRSTLNRLGKLILKTTKDNKALPRLWGVHDMTFALQHLTYSEIELLNLLDNKILKDSIKVAIVRNPFDRAVSSYHHMGKSYKNFLDFLTHYYTAPDRDHNTLAHKRPQIDYLRDKKGNMVIDYILRFENLEEDFEDFKLKYGISSSKIPHIGKQKSANYLTYYDEKSKKIVEELFQDDFQELDMFKII